MIQGSVEAFFGTTTIGWHHVKGSPTGIFLMTPLDSISFHRIAALKGDCAGLVRPTGHCGAAQGDVHRWPCHRPKRGVFKHRWELGHDSVPQGRDVRIHGHGRWRHSDSLTPMKRFQTNCCGLCADLLAFELNGEVVSGLPRSPLL